MWEQVELPRQLQRARIDVFHATANRGLPYRRVCKYVLTCHDIIDRLPEYCGQEHWRGRWRKKYADFVSRHSADKYVTVSEFSKRDICRFHGVPAERVLVIHNAASPRFHEKVAAEQIAMVREKYRLPEQYFLFLGGFDKRKNVATLVEAFAQLPKEAPPLVLAGEHKWEFAAISERIAALGLVGTSSVSRRYRRRRPACALSGSDCIGASLALRRLRPATGGSNGFGNSGAGFAKHQPARGARRLRFAVRSGRSGFHRRHRWNESRAISNLRTALIESGRERARFFSWRKAAEQTLGLYLELLGRGDEIARLCGREGKEQRR